MTNFGHHFDFLHQIHGYYAENQEYESTTFRKNCRKDHHTEIDETYLDSRMDDDLFMELIFF